MLSTRDSLRAALITSTLFLPIAHLKLSVFGLPLYSVEIPVFVALAVYLYGWQRGISAPFEKVGLRNLLLFAAALFFFGAALSFALNPFSLTGLGMLKTWFVVPLLWVWLWLKIDPTEKDLEYALCVWFGACVLGAGVSLIFFFQGMLTYDGRLAAWYASPNYLAFFLAPGTLLAYHFYFHTRSTFKPLLALALILLLIALFFTHSYAVWVSAALAGLIFLFLDTAAVSSWRKKGVAMLLLIILFGTFILFESGGEKWQSLMTLSPRSSLASRAMIWEASVRIIADHPLFGIGIGRFQEVYLSYQRYFPPYLEWAVPQPHSLYLALWLQTGLIGLSGFGLLVAVWLRKMSALQNAQSASRRVRKLGALLIALFTFYLLVGMVDTPFFKTDLAFTFWFILAFGTGLLRAQKKHP